MVSLNTDPCQASVQFTLDGQPLVALEGQTIAGALLAAGCRAWRSTERLGEPRGFFCGMGVCYDCLVFVEGQGQVRACQTLVADGMRVERPHRAERGAGS